MRLKTKLYLGFGSILLLLLVLAIISLSRLDQLYQDASEIVDQRYSRVRLATDVRAEINNISRGVTLMFLEKQPEQMRKNRELIQLSTAQVNTKLDQLARQAVSDSESQSEVDALLGRLQTLFASYQTTSNAMANFAVQGRSDEAVRQLTEDTVKTRNDLFQTITELTETEERAMDAVLIRSQSVYDNTMLTVICTVVLTLLVGAGITLWVTRSISSSIRRVTEVMSNTSYDTIDSLPRIRVTSKDEIGEISHAFNEMAQALEEHARHENEYRMAIQEQSWLKSKVAEMSTMYQGVQDVQTLAHLFLAKVTPMVGASYGVLYLRDVYGDDQLLQRVASYAYDSHAVGANGFRMGEGLVGQCALENQPKLLTNVPDTYLRIQSGLGASAPSTLLLLPIIYEGRVLAVLELASLEVFSTLYLNLLQELLTTLGITINSIVGHMRVEELLRNSQAMTEELQSQSEELQLQQEELRSINEQLEDQYKTSEQKTKELEVTKGALEEKARQVLISSKYKSEFLANMSHELRTPLNSLLILAQMLAENGEGNLTAKQVEFAQTIHSSGHDLLTLINDILDLSKVESGKMELYVNEMLLSDLESYVEMHFRTLARQKGLELRLERGADVPNTFVTDEHRLRQILKNLLANAIKFTEQGTVTFRMECVDGVAAPAKLAEQGPLLAFSVLDTGIGIPADKRDLIFEAFRQADGTTSRKFGGTGLGLSISREIAHLLGGQIVVESEEGQGSMFTLFLPLQYVPMEAAEHIDDQLEAAIGGLLSPVEAPEQDDHLAPEVSPQGTELDKNGRSVSGKKVLIVDDDMRNVFALTTALESQQMQVVFAENGREALELLEQDAEIDIVLMDIMMPEMDGYEAMRMIRSNAAYEQLPIIALTAKAMKYDREKCIEAGASDYISKPVNLEQLFSLIRVWLYR